MLGNKKKPKKPVILTFCIVYVILLSAFNYISSLLLTLSFLYLILENLEFFIFSFDCPFIHTISMAHITSLYRFYLAIIFFFF